MRSSGFTLLETAITLAILGVVVTVTYGVFARTLESKQYVESRALALADARGTFQRILSDLERALVAMPRRNPASESDFDAPERDDEFLFHSIDRHLGDFPRDELVFQALLRRPTSVAASAADVAIVRYRVTGAADEVPVLRRRASFALSGEDFLLDVPDPSREIIVLEGVVGFEVRFFDGREWVDEWDSADPQKKLKPPLAVSVQVAIQAGDGAIEAYSTSIDLPAAPVPERAG